MPHCQSAAIALTAASLYTGLFVLRGMGNKTASGQHQDSVSATRRGDGPVCDQERRPCVRLLKSLARRKCAWGNVAGRSHSAESAPNSSAKVPAAAVEVTCGPQGKGTVLATTVVETQGNGSALRDSRLGPRRTSG